MDDIACYRSRAMSGSVPRKHLLFYPKVALTYPRHPHCPVPPCSGATQEMIKDIAKENGLEEYLGSTLRLEWELFARSQFLGHRWPKTGIITPPTQPNLSLFFPSSQSDK